MIARSDKLSAKLWRPPLTLRTIHCSINVTRLCASRIESALNNSPEMSHIKWLFFLAPVAQFISPARGILTGPIRRIIIHRYDLSIRPLTDVGNLSVAISIEREIFTLKPRDPESIYSRLIASIKLIIFLHSSEIELLFSPLRLVNSSIPINISPPRDNSVNGALLPFLLRSHTERTTSRRKWKARTKPGRIFQRIGKGGKRENREQGAGVIGDW